MRTTYAARPVNVMVATILAIVVSITGIMAASAQQNQNQNQSQNQNSQQNQVQLDELMQNADQYLGADVTVSGSVGDEIEREAFTVMNNGEEVLVVGDRQAVPSNLPDNVQVQGTFEESFSVRDIENQLDINLNNNAYSQYEGQHFIIADQVDEAQMGNGQGDQQAQQVNVRDLANNSGQYTDQHVRVSGTLEDTPMPAIYMLSDDNAQVYVVVDPNMVPNNVQDQDSIEIRGTVYEVTRRQFSNTWNLNISSNEDDQSGDDQNEDNQDDDQNNQNQGMFPIVLIVADQVGNQQRQQSQADLQDIMQNTSDYTGQSVTVSGQVGDEWERRAFTITSNNQEILVIGDRQTVPRNLPDNVNVQGQVHESFNVVDAENQLGVNLNNNQLDEFEGQAYIMAEQVMDASQDGQNQDEDTDQNQNQNQNNDDDDDQDGNENSGD